MKFVKRNVKTLNWDEVNREALEDVNDLIIVINDIQRDIEGDLEKIELLKSLSGLIQITIKSKDVGILKYFDTLLREIEKPKYAVLLDDFENHDRTNIDFDDTNFKVVSVPPEYSQWGMRKQNFESEGANGTCFLLSEDDCSKENMSILDQEIDKWMQIPDLTDVDKVVLVANFLQRNVQYVSGEVSEAKGKKYIAKGMVERDFQSVTTLLNHHVGQCCAFSKVAMLMLNNPKMNVNCRAMTAPGHYYNIIYIGDEAYGLDMTWGVTRNPHRVRGNLKATEFCGDFLFFGQKELEEMNQPADHHTPLLPLRNQLQPSQLPREEIIRSREKLERYGINFSYPHITYVKQTEESEIQDEI